MTQEQESRMPSMAGDLLCRAHILYMEDDIGLGRLLQKRLERMACQVDIARDGQKGLEMFAAGAYDVVVADYNMPLVNGLEVLQQLKDDASVIILTGQGDEKVAVTAMKLGAADYVIKDAQGEYLEFLPAVIDRVIERQQLIRDRQQAMLELQASEARYRAIVEDQTEMVCRFQPNGQLNFANPSFCRFFGIRQSDVGFQNIASILTRKVYRQTQQVLKLLTPVKPVASNGHEVTMADGVIRSLQWINRGIFDASGKLKEYQLVGRDTTELRQLEEALRQTEEKYSRLLAGGQPPAVNT
ncbi:MAG: response regulator [Negativicutes bacterium]|nr:response regulator [Negativicutes bacterium]